MIQPYANNRAYLREPIPLPLQSPIYDGRLGWGTLRSSFVPERDTFYSGANFISISDA